MRHPHDRPSLSPITQKEGGCDADDLRDGSGAGAGDGIELVRELELYVGAGFTPAEALEAATIVPARLVGADKHTGSIAVGKDADLVLVDGDPSTKIGDLRHTRVVLMDGKLMDADKLRAAVGFSARPAFTLPE